MSDQRPVMYFTPELARQLRTAYELAKSEGLERFRFHGHDLLVSYAFYLLEYVENRFNMRGDSKHEK